MPDLTARRTAWYRMYRSYGGWPHRWVVTRDGVHAASAVTRWGARRWMIRDLAAQQAARGSGLDRP
jgi:hypothetical protein